MRGFALGLETFEGSQLGLESLGEPQGLHGRALAVPWGSRPFAVLLRCSDNREGDHGNCFQGRAKRNALAACRDGFDV